jgi:NADH-quinone oxidoreductase subunit I
MAFLTGRRLILKNESMKGIINYIKEIILGVITLIKGMAVTGRYFFTSYKTIVTQKYPENRKELVMFDRFKGEVIMIHDENNEHRCTGCGICEMNCPNGSIEIITKTEEADGKKKKVIDKHIYHLSMCTFCALCVKTCPSNALAFGQNFEHAVFDRRQLTKVLNKPGSVLTKEIKE